MALYWYEIAQANVTGLTKTKVEKRIADGQPAIRALTHRHVARSKLPSRSQVVEQIHSVTFAGRE